MLDQVMRHTARCERPSEVIKHNYSTMTTETHCRNCDARAIARGIVQRTPNGGTAA